MIRLLILLKEEIWTITILHTMLQRSKKYGSLQTSKVSLMMTMILFQIMIRMKVK
jgi:hypothetical protein